MLTTCINCATPFHYMHQGTVFELDRCLPPSNCSPAPAKARYVWLCNRCSELVQLAVDPEGNVNPVSLSLPHSRKTGPWVLKKLDFGCPTWQVEDVLPG